MIGPRASGKSTIGPLLAKAVGWPFVELDDVALKKTGFASIRQCWQSHGEQAWREAETAVFDGVWTQTGQVVALGGGAPAVPAIESTIQSRRARGQALVIRLHCPVNSLQSRLRADPGDRPSVTGTGVVDEVAGLLAKREPIYRRLADITCDTSGPNPHATVAVLLEDLRARWPDLKLGAASSSDRSGASS